MNRRFASGLKHAYKRPFLPQIPGKANINQNMGWIMNTDTSKKILMILLMSTVVIASFVSKYNELIQDFENDARAKQALINEYIQVSSNGIEMMAIAGNNYFMQKETQVTEDRQFLVYDPNRNVYSLDAVEGTARQKAVGNLTGIGAIPDQGVDRTEIDLALHFNQYFRKLHEKIPSIAWLYYTSENNFVNIYPWVASRDFVFSDKLKQEVFYRYVIPENNPDRRSRWTPVYLDHAGKGLMVTLSSPIYDKNVFKGALSLDLTVNTLSKMIDSEYDNYLVDETGGIIASSLHLKPDHEPSRVRLIMERFPFAPQIARRLSNNKVHREDEYFVYLSTFGDTPWKMVSIVSICLVLGQAVLFTFPVLLLCLVLSWTIIEVEKRRRAEAELSSSLAELQKLHALLEDAAKHDFLTSTVNRRGLKAIFSHDVDSPDWIHRPVSFVIGDIDFFKKVNDTYGHAVGDRVLIEIANLIRQDLANPDVVCRWGGEEFVVMLVGSTYGEAVDVAEKIRKKIEAMRIPLDNSSELQITMSFGVEEHQRGESVDETVSKADKALYVAKSKGRNRVCGYRDQL